MSPRPPDPPNETGRGGTSPAADGLPDSTNAHPTAPPAATQHAARWQVVTRKTSGASVVFGEYRAQKDALAIAARLREIGGNATIVEVLR